MAFYFHAEAHALAGKLKLPFEEEIKKQAFVKLEGHLADLPFKERAQRSYFSQHAKNFRLEGIVSYAAAHTQVTGHDSEKHAGASVTLATSVVEDLNILNVLTADRVVAQISTTHIPIEYCPHVTLLGTHFENLRIAGHRAEPYLKLDIAGARAEGRDVLPVNKGTRLMNAIEAQYKRLKQTIGTLDYKEREKMRLTDTDASLGKKYYGFTVDYAKIQHQAQKAKEGNDWDGITCSLVEHVEIKDISVKAADGQAIQIPPAARTFGHVIHIPGFGNIFLAELTVKHNSYNLTMIRLEMGCLAGGSIRIATCDVNGWSGGGGNGGGRYDLGGAGNGGIRRETLTAPAAAATMPAQRASAESAPPAPPAAEPLVADEPPKGFREGQTAASLQAYPWIIPTSEHVVQKALFDVVIELRLVSQAGTWGNVSLPKVDKPLTLGVHLLFEGQSQWDTLEFSWANQTTKQAKFPGLKAPKYRNKNGDPDFRGIRANFYLNNRWIGEGLKNIEILPRVGAEEAEQITEPTQPEWRKYLNVGSTEIAPPDLLVRIQRIDNENYYWSFYSPHADFSNLDDTKCKLFVRGGVEQYVKVNFEPLARVTLTDLTLTRLRGTCKEIYANTPPAFKDIYWQLYNAAQEDTKTSLDSIQFVSDEPYVPWEIMLVDDQQRGPDLKPEILSVRHAVGRWIANESCQIRPSIPAQEMAIFASDYQKVPSVIAKLTWAEEEAQHLENRYQNKPKAVRYDLQQAKVLRFLKEGSAQVVHFSCHGRMDPLTPSSSVLLLEDDQTNFTPAVLRSPEIQRGIGAQHPLVFLNACQVGGTGVTISFVTGWPEAFLAMGASAVIAPLWSVGDECARDVAESFYDYVISNSPISIGAALQHIRDKFNENRQMTYLAYLLYGDPTALISID